MSKSVLVLNQDYQPVAICSAERAFVLVYVRKAEMVEAMPGLTLRSVNQSFRYPSIIRLQRYIHVPYRKVSLSRINVFRRDGNQCLYCGSKSDLTLDHVLPKAMGGKDTWENLATACQTCNTRKGNRTPEQSNMVLRRKPYRPSYIMYLTNFAASVQESWRPYLMI
jgi:5-methylcytosine-specific restriction endonuclease McrA